jgi:hypothetical protein
MPEDGIKRLLVTIGAASGRLEPHDVVTLQRHFGVGFSAILYRLLHLRLPREADFAHAARCRLGRARLANGLSRRGGRIPRGG